MTTKFEYKCNSCGHYYIEQRNNDKLIPYFSKCNSCINGNYEEINKTVLSEDVEIIIEQPIVEEVIPE